MCLFLESSSQIVTCSLSPESITETGNKPYIISSPSKNLVKNEEWYSYDKGYFDD
jgi:hypothetical protein